jgi:nucleoid-associated protein YgaU
MAPTAAEANSMCEPPKIHIAKQGELLRQLAKLHYGDENKWQVIYNANKAVIGSAYGLNPVKRTTSPVTRDCDFQSQGTDASLK